ncbi:MAG: MBL fold metallo-hydrolase [Elusimicrobiaceae bacterium]|nr:MBL fold metallo-hydrolase [Elusimicrobiaceae bacterium]
MEITFLGTNGWFDTHTGATSCVFLNTKEAYIVLDCGSGFYKVPSLLKEDKPIFLLLTHLHLDHICALQMLPLLKNKNLTIIVVGKQQKEDLQKFMQLPFMPTAKMLGIKIAEIEEIKNKLPFKVEYYELAHAVKTFGYKIFAESKIVAYGLDSGLCENILHLVKDSDLFICECSYLPNQEPDFNHLNPKAAALIAKEAKAKLLALIHFKADVYDTFEKRDLALLCAGEHFEKVFAPYDGDIITI